MLLLLLLFVVVVDLDDIISLTEVEPLETTKLRPAAGPGDQDSLVTAKNRDENGTYAERVSTYVTRRRSTDLTPLLHGSPGFVLR